MQPGIACASSIAAEAPLTLVAEHPVALLRVRRLRSRAWAQLNVRTPNASTSGLDRN